MPKKEDLVSIITPTYNSSKFIEDTVKSVQEQTYDNWELLITDDCSTDNTFSILERLANKDDRIKIYRLAKNSGPAVARNNSIEKAKGKYLAFLDSDDLWTYSKLQLQISEMNTTGSYVSHTGYVHINESSNEIGIRVNAIKSLSYKKLLRNNYVGNLTGVYNMQKLGKIYCPLIKKRQDWAVWVDALKSSKQNSLGIQQDLAQYRIRKDSISSNKFKLINHNYLFYKKHLKFSALKSTFRMLIFFYEYFFIRTKYIQKYDPKDCKSSTHP
ncbi:MAG: glycosyltransferase family 2 protein [Psychroflexus halocasei]